MDRAEALALLGSKSSGHLATITPDSRPHIVVITFALDHDKIVTAIDHKPKSRLRLQRLSNIERSPSVAFLVDEYSDDWSSLWWVRVDGRASIHVDGPEFESAVDALVRRYPQYQDVRPVGPVIAIDIDEVSWWSSTR